MSFLKIVTPFIAFTLHNVHTWFLIIQRLPAAVLKRQFLLNYYYRRNMLKYSKEIDFIKISPNLTLLQNQQVILVPFIMGGYYTVVMNILIYLEPYGGSRVQGYHVFLILKKLD